ncbi:hypothetical protein [Microcoleus sp. D2_18a_D3]|uniref:hypothetical protein n=1 Tax=Microcoleus sp. D2_18a_D3 TaxID=3055330 RepID=UPI002FCF086E
MCNGLCNGCNESSATDFLTDVTDVTEVRIDGLREEGKRKKEEGRKKRQESFRFYLPFFQVYFRFLIPGSKRYKAKLLLLLVYKSCGS